MSDDEPTTLGASVFQTLAVPAQPVVRAFRRARLGETSPLAAVGTCALFIPLILLYEAFAVPLVAGATLLTALLMVPIGVVSLAASLILRLRRQ